jgi:uncharacterized protein
VTPLVQHLAAAGAAAAAGVVNAVAGGGTLISFPTLVALGLPALDANVTNTVALSPGYLGGTIAQRADLADLRHRLPTLLVAACLGGLGGSLLLVHTTEALFRDVVPFLILFACALLGLQDVIKRRLGTRVDAVGAGNSAALLVAVFGAALYGGYFGAGLGIMLLATLGLTINEQLNKLNALKQALSFAINVVAAAFFSFSGKVAWSLAAVMAAASLLGGNVGGRIASRLNPRILRAVVITLGVAVAARFLWGSTRV